MNKIEDTYFELLPNEVVYEILLHLDKVDLIALFDFFPQLKTRMFWILKIYGNMPLLNSSFRHGEQFYDISSDVIYYYFRLQEAYKWFYFDEYEYSRWKGLSFSDDDFIKMYVDLSKYKDEFKSLRIKLDNVTMLANSPFNIFMPKHWDVEYLRGGYDPWNGCNYRHSIYLNYKENVVTMEKLTFEDHDEKESVREFKYECPSDKFIVALVYAYAQDMKISGVTSQDEEIKITRKEVYDSSDEE